MARFAGIVHGVVVQISTEARFPAAAGKRAAKSAALSAASGNSTWIDGETCDSYSTSASASAVRQWMHQWTGFLPR